MRRRGRRVNIWGVWEPQVSFEYALILGSLTTETYLKLMEWQAQIAQRRLEHTGKLTVIIQGNASVHPSLLTQQQWERWQQQGLLIFFLPPYSPQMNRIEDEWLHGERDELASPRFCAMSTIWHWRSHLVWKPGRREDSMLKKAFSV